MSDNKDLRKSLSKLTEIVKELKKADFGNTGQDSPSQSSAPSYTDKWGKLKGQGLPPKYPGLENIDDLYTRDKKKPPIGPKMQKADQNGHATIGNPMKTTKPMAAAKPPTMPIAKANVPAPGKSIPAAKTSVPSPKTTAPVKNIKCNISKERAYMKVQKSIVLISKEIDPTSFHPISDNIIMKSFGSIPEIMKDINNRPHESWWNRGMDRAQNFTEQPANYLGRIWYGDVSKEAPWGEENYSSRRDVEDRTEEEDPDNEALKKWVGGALEGGGLSSLRNHPRAGSAIKNAATYIGKSVLGRSDKIFKSGIGDIDPSEIGSIVLDAIDEIVTASHDDKLQKAWAGTAAGLMTKSWEDNIQGEVQDAPAVEHERPFVPVNKSVAEPLSSKNNPQKRKSKLGEEYDGESAVSGDGAKSNVHEKGGLLDKNETLKDY